jgi:hypothetical protein
MGVNQGEGATRREVVAMAVRTDNLRRHRHRSHQEKVAWMLVAVILLTVLFVVLLDPEASGFALAGGLVRVGLGKEVSRCTRRR